MADVIIGKRTFSSAFSKAFETSMSIFSAGFELNIPDVYMEALASADTISASAEVLSPIEIITDQILESDLTNSYFVMCSPTVTTDGDNIINCHGSLPNNYWNKESPCRDNEKDMYNTIQMDAWNSWGISMSFYITDWNTDYDKIYGEDRDRHITRTFSFKGYIESYPEEKRHYTDFGIEGLDNFIFYINIDHFSFVSRLDEFGSTCFESHVPIEGDIVKFDYSGLYYEIMHVVQSANQFLQTQHSYTIIARVFRDTHISLSPSVSSDNISAYTDKDEDILDISGEIDVEKEEFLYDPTLDTDNDVVDQHPPKNDNPFGSW